MTYILSDPHGEYDLFCRLLEKIRLSTSDTMYICGDLIDKGPLSVRLCRLVFSLPQVQVIMGNHEYVFLQYYHRLMEESPDDFEEVLTKLSAQFSPLDDCLDWDVVDALEELPFYAEHEDFLCVHAGVEITEAGLIRPPAETPHEILIYDRHFKCPEVRHNSQPCVFYGHTHTDAIEGNRKPAILAYRRIPEQRAVSVTDYDKIHLDTGAWKSGVMGCFCLETLRAIYVSRPL